MSDPQRIWMTPREARCFQNHAAYPDQVGFIRAGKYDRLKAQADALCDALEVLAHASGLEEQRDAFREANAAIAAYRSEGGEE